MKTVSHEINSSKIYECDSIGTSCNLFSLIDKQYYIMYIIDCSHISCPRYRLVNIEQLSGGSNQGCAGGSKPSQHGKGGENCKYTNTI